jgi:hypothetical protein
MASYSTDRYDADEIVQELLDGASPDIRQLLGKNYHFPEVLDAAEPGNAEGRA